MAKKPGKPLLDQRVRLTDLVVLAEGDEGLYGRSNRKTRGDKVYNIVKEFDENGLRVFVLFRDKKGRLHILDGHHRREACSIHCEEVGIDPQQFMVRADIYDDSCVPAGTDPGEYIDALIKQAHTRSAENHGDYGSRHWNASPWRIPAINAGFDGNFTNSHRVIMWDILKARLAVDEYAAFQRDGHTVDDFLVRLRINASREVLDKALREYDLVTIGRTVRTLAAWDGIVGVAAEARKLRGFRKPLVLAVVLFLVEDSNAKVDDISRRVLARIESGALGGIASQNIYDVAKELLGHINFNRPIKNHVRFLGRPMGRT